MGKKKLERHVFYFETGILAKIQKINQSNVIIPTNNLIF